MLQVPADALFFHACMKRFWRLLDRQACFNHNCSALTLLGQNSCVGADWRRASCLPASYQRHRPSPPLAHTLHTMHVCLPKPLAKQCSFSGCAQATSSILQCVCLSACAGTSMTDMVEAGITEEVHTDTQAIPQGHGVEARLALAERVRQGFSNSIGNVMSHKLTFTPAGDVESTASGDLPLVDEAQPLVEPAGAEMAEHEHARQHAIDVLTEAAVHQSHTHGSLQPGHVQQENLPAAEHLATGANEGVINPELPIVGDVPPAEESAAHEGVFGHHNAAQLQEVTYGGALTQLVSFGLPCAFVLAAAAFVLWRRLGASRSSTARV